MPVWLIVGLGNPGDRYDNTRHNAGFLAADVLASSNQLVWKESKKLDAQLCEGRLWKLLKPETYMNASGMSVRKAVDYFKIPLSHLIVIHDDLDLPLGQAKVAWARGPHIHNGVLSVEEYLGTKEFWRIRMGVDSRTPEERHVITGERYVLKPLDYTEKKLLHGGVLKAEMIANDIMKGRYVTSG